MQKGLAFVRKRSGSVTVPGANRAPGSCPAGCMARVGLWWWRQTTPHQPNGGSRCQDLPIRNSSFCPRSRGAMIAELNCRRTSKEKPPERLSISSSAPACWRRSALLARSPLHKAAYPDLEAPLTKRALNSLEDGGHEPDRNGHHPIIQSDRNVAVGMSVSAHPRSRVESRREPGLRMMPSFPRPSLSFRTAGFPRYGWKAGMSGGAFPHINQLKPAPGIHLLMFSLRPPFAHLVARR
jgi:hypothetical protein